MTQVEDIESAKHQIERIVDLHIRSEEKEESYRVFIMSKIPYACYLGYVLGNKVKSEAFQYFRDTEDWKWKETAAGHFLIEKPEAENENEVNLLIEVSGIIDRTLIPDKCTYSIKADSPGFMFLQSKEQIVEFRNVYRNLLSEIREKHGETVIVNLIVAIPNPISFEIGKSIMKNIDPTIRLYDKVENDIYYKPVMYLHERIR